MPYMYVTGNDEDGHSAVIARRALIAGAEPLQLLRIEEPVFPLPEGSGATALLESPTAPGGVLYNVHTWQAGQRTRMHRTTTVDVDVVLQGSLQMELETETVTLRVGDCALLPGVAHAWCSSEEGAIVLYSLLAAEPSGADRERPRHPFGG